MAHLTTAAAYYWPRRCPGCLGRPRRYLTRTRPARDSPPEGTLRCCHRYDAQPRRRAGTFSPKWRKLSFAIGSKPRVDRRRCRAIRPPGRLPHRPLPALQPRRVRQRLARRRWRWTLTAGARHGPGRAAPAGRKPASPRADAAAVPGQHVLVPARRLCDACAPPCPDATPATITDTGDGSGCRFPPRLPRIGQETLQRLPQGHGIRCPSPAGRRRRMQPASRDEDTGVVLSVLVCQVGTRIITAGRAFTSSTSAPQDPVSRAAPPAE